jgi:EAL domain-containing protein (putative c-di-GMP-specific phosphodiesterase class I)/GGDEF domain-containing protein
LTSINVLTHNQILVAAEQAEKIGPIMLAKVQIDNLSWINAQFGDSFGDETIARFRELLLNHPKIFAVGEVSVSMYACLINVEETPAEFFKSLEDSLGQMNRDSLSSFAVEISVGLVVVERQSTEPMAEWIKKANKALLVSIRTGKSTSYTNELEVQLIAQRHLLKLKGAEELPDEFSWVYQPVVNISDLSVEGYEALVRWDSLALGLISPEVFIPIAEHIGVISVLDRAAVKSASEASRHLLLNSGQAMGVNVSAVTLETDANFVDFVIGIKNSRGFGEGRLVLELTETAVVENLEKLSEVIILLRAEGIEISIDDFGKGETNLNTLSHLTIDYIKLDKGLLRLKTPKATRAMLKIGTEMAKMLDAVIVCEGIETEEDLEMCKELGIKLGQGWLLGMPEPLLIQESNS